MATPLPTSTRRAGSSRTGCGGFKQLGRVNTGGDRSLNGCDIDVFCTARPRVVGYQKGGVATQIELTTITELKGDAALLAGKNLFASHNAIAFDQQALFPVGSNNHNLTNNLSNFCAGSHFHDSFHFMWTTAPGTPSLDDTREPSASLHLPSTPAPLDFP